MIINVELIDFESNFTRTLTAMNIYLYWPLLALPSPRWHNSPPPAAPVRNITEVQVDARQTVR